MNARAALSSLLAGRCWLLAACARHDESTLPGTVERDRVELVADANEFIVVTAVRRRRDASRPATSSWCRIARCPPPSSTPRARNSPRPRRASRNSRTARAAPPSAPRLRAAMRARAQRDDAVRERDRLLGLVARSLVSKSEADRQVVGRECRRGQPARSRGGPARTAGRHARRTTRAGAPGRRQRARQSRGPRDHAPRVSKCARRSPAPSTALPFHVGEKPARGATVAVLLATTAPFARIHVPEPMRARVKVGTRPRSHVDGIDADLQGPGALHRERSRVHALLLAHGRGPLAPVVPRRGGVRRCGRRARCRPACRSTSRWSSAAP